MQQIGSSVDDVVMTHSHGPSEEQMTAVDDGRIDGLRVRQYSCGCGFAAAVLSRVEDEEPGISWPYRLQPITPLV